MILKLHRLNACFLGLFLAAHLINHLLVAFSPTAHIAAMHALRVVYRNGIIEPLLLARPCRPALPWHGSDLQSRQASRALGMGAGTFRALHHRLSGAARTRSSYGSLAPRFRHQHLVRLRRGQRNTLPAPFRALLHARDYRGVHPYRGSTLLSRPPTLGPRTASYRDHLGNGRRYSDDADRPNPRTLQHLS